MKIAIIGLPNSGKTTVFNALTRNVVETASFSSGRLEPNLAIVKVPDKRLPALNEIYRPKKLTHAEVQYVDIGGFSGADKRQEVPAEVLHYIGTADALLHVVRAFEDDSVPHPLDRVDAQADLQALDLELIFSDLMIVERRLEKLEKEISKLPTAARGSRIKERDVLKRLSEALESERPIRDIELSPEEQKVIRGYQFLSEKPVLVVVNISESDLGNPPDLEYVHAGSSVVFLSARVEAELAQMDDEEAVEFLEALEIDEPARDRVIAESYELLGLLSFLTVGEDEVRAWTVKRGTRAPAAGGVIHSDIERGFIRAEVVPFQQLVDAGNLSAAKKKGLVRLEGKEYVVQDGDISHFLFNV
ncbi:MAG: redox-regulated ATPase YchF [Acidobacteriota bacterium]|nr:MAG: redox-regulated ATPase YchF [Acidobacteriota bacterium]